MAVNYNAEPILTVDGLKQYFKVSSSFTVHAVEDVSFKIYPGETYGLVGESGSGKSTIGRSVIRLYDPTAGTIKFNGMDIGGKMNKETNKALRTQMQMIFQDPMASLNPRKKVRDILGEGLDIHHMYKSKEEREEKIKAILAKVGLAPEHAARYPHQFSGGQRQRVGIARALIMNPKLIIADECISALDVSIQAQVVNMLEDFQDEMNFSYLFIAHDLSMVKHISDRVGVMYLGNMVEFAESDELYQNPLHPYTKALMAAIPIPDPDTEEQKKRIRLEGEIPSPVNPKPGCRFVTRCRYATEKCHQETPQLEELKPEHFVACHRAKELMEDHPQE